MLGNASGIDLNNSDLQEMEKIGGLGRVLALRIIQHRPIRRWDDLKMIEGFGLELMKDLRGSGARLGRISRSTKEKSKATGTSTELRKPSGANAAASGPTRTASNLFSGRGMHPED